MTTPKAPEVRYRRRVRVRADDLPDVLSTDQAASLMGCGINHVRDLVKSGDLPRLPWGGRAIRIAKADVLACLRWRARHGGGTR